MTNIPEASKPTPQDSLKIRLGQFSAAGRKAENQDFHGAILATGDQLVMKGIAVALADGISSSAVSAQAAQTAIGSFLSDYYSTPDSWPVRQSATRVIEAVNGWLHSQNVSSLNPDRNAGMICTFDALVLKGHTAYLFHAGDARIYRLRGKNIEQLTQDHRIPSGDGGSYLARGLGIQPDLALDYRTLPLEEGDMFILATDGVYEFKQMSTISSVIDASDTLDNAAEQIAQQAIANGSDDNVTVQLVRVDHAAPATSAEILTEAQHLSVAGHLSAGDELDGLRIVREVHSSSRSRVLLACDANDQQVIIKIPSTELRENQQYLSGFMLEEWVARRLKNDHLMQAAKRTVPATSLYVVMRYFEGETLRQWMRDHPNPDMAQVRSIIGQIISGLRALQRKHMLHQDLRPENIMINREGTVKIIDFGSVYIPGVEEALPGIAGPMPGTFQYTAPEYLSGDMISWRSDQFSLAVIAYEMLTGQLPYGTAVAKISNISDQRRLKYTPARTYAPTIPLWVDRALRKALQPDPLQRYDALSEFFADISAPSPPTDTAAQTVPLAQRNPTLFWKIIAAFFALSTAVLSVLQFGA